MAENKLSPETIKKVLEECSSFDNAIEELQQQRNNEAKQEKQTENEVNSAD